MGGVNNQFISGKIRYVSAFYSFSNYQVRENVRIGLYFILLEKYGTIQKIYD
jgi:hypothetical protein